MKKALVLLSLVLFIGITNAQDINSKQPLTGIINSQDVNLNHPLLKVTSFSSSIGFAGAMTSNTDEDYYSLKDAAENPDLFVDVTGFSNKGNTWNPNGMQFGPTGISYAGSFSGSLLFNLGLNPYSKKLGKYRDNRELRFSAGGNIGVRNTFNYYDNHTFVIDTFQSVNGSGVVYADSSISSNYYYELDFTDINFGFSYLFKTDVNRRVHFYAGAGINYGIAIKSSVSVSHSTYRSVYYYNEFDKPSEDELYYYGNYNNSGYTDSYSTTNLKSPMQFIRAYIPLGLSLRLSKKPDSFFNQVDLYTEFNPGVELQIIGSGKTYVNPYFGFAFIGFNYHW